MKITHDHEANAAYIRLLPERGVRTESLSMDCNIDWSEDGRVVGVELLNVLSASLESRCRLCVQTNQQQQASALPGRGEGSRVKSCEYPICDRSEDDELDSAIHTYGFTVDGLTELEINYCDEHAPSSNCIEP